MWACMLDVLKKRVGRQKRRHMIRFGPSLDMFWLEASGSFGIYGEL